MTDLFAHALQFCSVLIINTVMGGVIWALADDEDEVLLDRYLEISGESWVTALIILQLWPLALIFAWQIRRHR